MSLGRVLIIDDEAALRSTLARVLQSGGCDTAGAADGRQALQQVEAGPFDLVYLDLHLPDMDGIQILSELRRRAPDLPVILLTGFGSLQTAVEALRLGATDYLLKPFDPEVLLARTRVVLTEQRLERRRSELRRQIAALQAELAALDRPAAPPGPPPAAAEPLHRFIKLGRLIIDLQGRRATLGEQVLTLPPSAFDYLTILARRSPEVVDYVSLVSEAQGYQVDPGEARELAKWHLHVLRSAIEPDPQRPQYLINVRGEGYRLVVD
ncbi:MAG: response regulator transcription factor [Chloroflexota bacterium]